MLSACPAGGVIDGTVLEIGDFTQNLDVSLLCSTLTGDIVDFLV